jgi:hypothetical protein
MSTLTSASDSGDLIRSQQRERGSGIKGIALSEVRRSGWERMAVRGGLRRGVSGFIRSRGRGVGWNSSDAIGRHGRCSGAARWTDSIYTNGGVGGALV